jgi:hypothetical protein
VRQTKVKIIRDGAAGTRRAVAGRKVAGPSLQDLRQALTEINVDASLCGHVGGSEALNVTSSEGWPVRELRIVEEVLSDLSKTYTVIAMFWVEEETIMKAHKAQHIAYADDPSGQYGASQLIKTLCGQKVRASSASGLRAEAPGYKLCEACVTKRREILARWMNHLIPILDLLMLSAPAPPARKEAPMDTAHMLSELHDQRERLDRLILAAEDYARSGAKRRGRPPKWMSATKRRGRPPGSKNKQPIQMAG